MITPEGPLTDCLQIAGDMLAATAKWQELCAGDGDGGRARIFIAEVPRRPSANLHESWSLSAGLPYAIVHFDDEGVASTFTHQAASNYFVSSQSLIARLYLSPPSDMDSEDINQVEPWALNTVGRIIRGADAQESPGLLDLSHRGGMLMIRQLDVLGLVHPDRKERAAGHRHVGAELILQTGVNG